MKAKDAGSPSACSSYSNAEMEIYRDNFRITNCCAKGTLGNGLLEVVSPTWTSESLPGEADLLQAAAVKC